MRCLLVWQAIERRWSRVLNIQETRVLQRLVDLTLGWSKDTWTGTAAIIANGRTGRGEWVMGGLDMSVKSVRRALDGLRGHGLIVTETVIGERGEIAGMKFAPSFELLLAQWETTAVAPTLKIGKHRAAAVGSGQADQGVWTHSPGGMDTQSRGYGLADHTDITTYTTTTHNHSSQPASPSAPQAAGASLFQETSTEVETSEASDRKSPARVSNENAVEAAAAVQAKATERRATSLELATQRLADDSRSGAKGDGAKRLIADVRTFWSATWFETYEHAVAAPDWSPKERRQAQMVFDRWPSVNGRFTDFLTWVVGEWPMIMRARFAWMTKPAPEHPDVGFLLAFMKEFEEGWASRKKKALLRTGELSWFRQLVLTGHSEEEALEALLAKRIARVSRELPAARVRPRPAQTLQPVATDRGLPGRSLRPTNVPQLTAEACDEFERLTRGRGPK